MNPSPHRLADLQQAAADYYAETLASDHGAGPRAYLTGRGLGWAATASPAAASVDNDAGSAWLVGYALPGWTALTGHLRSRGYGDAELLEAGLTVTTRRGTVVDRFRDRIMLGIRAAEGALVGFIGRSAPGADANVPKYLNSPRSVLFDKSRVLFGLAEQRHAFADGAIPVVVEGPLDVLALARAGPTASTTGRQYVAVSPCGTALTRGHVTTLTTAITTSQELPDAAPPAGSLSEVLVAFDADVAGRRAATAAYLHLAGDFESVRNVHLPPGHDPASLLADDPRQMTRALTNAGSLLDDLVDDVLQRHHSQLGNAEIRVRALREAMQLVAGLPPRDVSRQVARIASRLGFPVAIATAELTEAVGRVPRTSVSGPSNGAPQRRLRSPAANRAQVSTAGPRDRRVGARLQAD